MDWSPLIEASLPIKVHFFTVVPAFFIGTWMIFLSTKGAPVHRAMGYAYFGLMGTTAFAAFFIRSSTGGFSFIHLFIPLTAWAIFSAYRAIKRGDVQGHRYSMYGLYVGGLMIAGALTFLPGRRMHEVFFGA